MATKRSSAKSMAGKESGSRAEQGVQAFRDALDKSVTISRDRLQEVFDDAVKRGRMTRRDAEDLLGRLVSRGREGAEDVIAQLESVLAQLGDATEYARRRARIPGFPITAYDQLNVRQIDDRLQDLSPAQLRKVRDYEQEHKARKGVLRAVDRKLKR